VKQSKTNPPASHGSLESNLLVDFGDLWSDAQKIWDRYQDTPAFSGYVSADYLAVYRALLPLCGTGMTFLEWGSGLGVVTIMANRMGFDACGIEAESGLVEHARELSRAYAPRAVFAMGSFFPDQFVGDETVTSATGRTIRNVNSAYGEIGKQLDEFDLVYAYPWPNERMLYRSVMRECGRRGAIFLTYDSRSGMDVLQVRRGSRDEPARGQVTRRRLDGS
tara:strand:- start:72512 stop:73174 length:663 start_codon:yes stop_codon:yes gene_type:complete